MNNSEGEWCVAYHGVARDQQPDKVLVILEIFIKVVLNHQQEEK